MTKGEIAAICKRCREYEKAANEMPATAETNEAIKQVRAKAKELRLVLKSLPDVVRVNLPANVRKMLESEKRRKARSQDERELLDFIEAQEPELLRLLRSIEDSLKGKSARVNKAAGNQPDHYSECVLGEMLRCQPGSEYKTMRAIIFALADKFGIEPESLYYRHTHRKK